MRNIQIIDGAENGVHDVFAASDTTFDLLFPGGTDIAFAEDFDERPDRELLAQALDELWRHITVSLRRP
jgi:hypothetical protein